MAQTDQAGRADRQGDGAEPEQRLGRHGSPGSLGIWVNGEMSIISMGHCSGGPNSKTATAATTIVAGSRANAASSNLGTWVLTDPVRTP